ncbi:DNA mismatch repair endonuclease MutL [Fusibacter sp. JL216-2]|uniref:DNA mismatch repair endonuclease MutL n=1 Tax=Fusibacter sp. JL216-2 TaxID=3071453 RepID=UPI003D3315D6
MDVITRQATKETGIKLSMSGGRKLSNEETGCPVGTTMVVKDLFFNTPARLKFLKSDNAEVTAISDIVNKLALSHSEIGFRYIVNDKNMFTTPGKGDLFKAIYAVYDKEMTRNLIPIDKTENGLTIKGFMTNLQYTRGNRSMQNFFVNGRYVKSSLLMDGLSMAYRTMLTPGRFPACFIMVDIDHTKVDVNIHPAKTEIKFHQEGIVKQIMYTAVRETLLSYNQTPVVSLSDDKLFKKVVMDEGKASDKTNKDDVPVLYNTPKKTDNGLIEKKVEDIRRHPVYESKVKSESGHEKQVQAQTQMNSGVKSESESVHDQALEKGSLDQGSNSTSGGQAYAPKKDNPQETHVHGETTLNKEDETVKERKQDGHYNKSVTYTPANSGLRAPSPSIAENSGFSYKDIAPDLSALSENALTVKDPFIREDKRAETNLEDIAVTRDLVGHKAEIYEDLRYIGQIFMTYLIFEKSGRMYLIDQHAAHEKILYESLLDQYRRSALDRQILLDPILIEMSYSEHGSVMSNMKAYESLGLAIDDFGGNTIVIREIPALLGRDGAHALFRKATDRLASSDTTGLEATSEKLEKIMQESCKTAIKAHDHMADMEVETLTKQLSELSDPYTCPHGRPIIISITKSEIEKKFKRT